MFINVSKSSNTTLSTYARNLNNEPNRNAKVEIGHPREFKSTSYRCFNFEFL